MPIFELSNQLEVVKSINTDEIQFKQVSFIQSLTLVEQTKKFKVFASIFVVIIGLVGHVLTICVFSQRRFRTNSSNIISLCLAFNDSIFLIVHFFEDTVLNIKEIYFGDIANQSESIKSIIEFLNLIDENDLTCRIINYLRYVLRFISAYIFVTFTIQRLLIVYSPLSNRFKSKTSAWLTVLLITLVSLCANTWTLFIFEINTDGNDKYCDIKQKWRTEYFRLNAIYIFSIILIPILVIIISNILMIVKLIKNNAKRKKLQPINRDSNMMMLEIKPVRKSHNSSRANLRNPMTKVNSADSRSKRLTKRLILISFSYAFLNLPYLITWSVFFSIQTFRVVDSPTKVHWFSAVQIAEIFYILNYSLHFYLYCISGSLFRNQLKNLRINRYNL